MKNMKKTIVLIGVLLAASLPWLGCNKAAKSSQPSEVNPTTEVTPTAQDIVAKVRDAYAALSSYGDSGTVTMSMGSQDLSVNFKTRLARTNLYRIEWEQSTGIKGAVWSAGAGDYLQVDAGSEPGPAAAATMSASGLKNDSNSRKMPDRRAALVKAVGLTYGGSSVIPGVFFNQNYGDAFVWPAISGHHPLKQEPDATVGGVDCYVVSTEVDLSKEPNAQKPGTESATVWIGKQDFLIHQSRTRYMEKVDDKAAMSDKTIDEACKKSLEMQNKPATPEAIAALRPQMRTIMKQVESTLKTNFKNGVVTTQTHEDISVNQNFSPSDFGR